MAGLKPVFPRRGKRERRGYVLSLNKFHYREVHRVKGFFDGGGGRYSQLTANKSKLMKAKS